MEERVRAIIKEGGNILLIHRVKKGREYWVFPGGGAEKTDADHKSALARECKEEIGVDIQVSDLFSIYELGEAGKGQREYFYFCKITGGKLGTGSGPEFQEGTHYEGMYVLEWIPLIDFSIKNIQPEEVKKKLQREA